MPASQTGHSPAGTIHSHTGFSLSRKHDRKRKNVPWYGNIPKVISTRFLLQWNTMSPIRSSAEMFRPHVAIHSVCRSNLSLMGWGHLRSCLHYSRWRDLFVKKHHVFLRNQQTKKTTTLSQLRKNIIQWLLLSQISSGTKIAQYPRGNRTRGWRR